MQTTVESTDKHTVKLTIEVPQEEFSKDLDRAYRSIANAVKIPGFRKGKVPKQIIDAQVGRDVVMQEFLEESVPVYYRNAVREQDLAPITDPDIDLHEMEDGRPLVFTAVVEVRPRLELIADDYKGVKVQAPPTEVSDQEVDEWVERLRQRFAELEPTQRPAADGDFVVADFRATVHDEEVPEATRSDYLYGLGAGEFGQKVDEEIVGKKAGDIVKVNATLPERFGEPHGGAEVTFQVLVKEVKSVRLPAPDDAFAKTASEFDTMQELRADLREKLGELKEREIKAVLRDRVLDALIDRVDVDIPETLVEEETDHRVNHARERAQRAGSSLEEALAAQGWDEARLREDAREHALRAIKADLVLEAVARGEQFEVTAEEIGAEVGALASAYGRETKELAKQLDRSGQIVTLAGDIIRSKALDLLVEHADIETVSGSEAPATEAGAERGQSEEDHE
ncbi:MAG TPA: trigger factor [Actinomycetota bacterium]|jgi:trigger factor|nr:trigger factor [Actinomycetota bacterium]